MITPTGENLHRYLDLIAARQKLTAANIANAATPGYKTKDIDFHGEFERAVDRGQTRADAVGVEAVEVLGLKGRNDGNNVSLDRESRMLAENSLRFNVASNLWKSQHRQLRAAIQEGRNG